MRRGSRLFGIAAAVLTILINMPEHGGPVLAAGRGPVTLQGHVPDVVKDGQARQTGHHSGAAPITLTIALPLRNRSVLDQFLAGVSRPGTRHYMTQAEANQAFNPTPEQEQRVSAWLQANGFTVTRTYANHLLVDARGTFAQAERMLAITLNDYTATVGGKQVRFFSTANEPTVDAAVSDVVRAIVGLDSYPRFYPGATNGTATGKPPYYPQDFANAYDVNPLWSSGETGSGQHIAITLFNDPPPDSTLQYFASGTGANTATRANGRLKWYAPQGMPVPNPNDTPAGNEEAAMDIEYASGLAPGAIIDYYEASNASDYYPDGSLDTGTLDALNAAGTNADDTIISNSWGQCEASSSTDVWTTAAEQIFSANAATNHNYLFSAGDNGSWCKNGQDPWPDYPTSSAYVTSVGGTRFSNNIGSTWPGETTWQYCQNSCDPSHPTWPVGSGGGYSNLWPRPQWQVASGLPASGLRGYPDIAADGDPNTGAEVCYYDPTSSNGTSCGGIGGTSLAAPLWAGMLADVNQHLSDNTQYSSLGFLPPWLYYLANNSQPYAPFHDITSGTNGSYDAATGWDPVTGWGSPNLDNFAYDVVVDSGSPPTVANVSPSSGPAAGGTSVVITGTGFSSATLVYFGATEVGQFTIPNGSDTEIDTLSPPGSATVDVTVVNGAGTSATSAADQFTYTAAATATGHPTSTRTPTSVPTATRTATSVPTATRTATGVATATRTSTPVNTATPSPTGTAVPSTTPTPTPTATGTPLSAGTTSASSTAQYTLTGSDGGAWMDMDPANLSLTITPSSSGMELLSANSDLWTSSAGYNQDIGIWVAGGPYGSGQVVAWKESGGFAGTFSPNAAFVQSVIPVSSGVTYTIKLVWKANKADPGTIWAGAGPINNAFSPTRLTGEFVPGGSATAVSSIASTQQYTLTGSDGSTWTAMDGSNLSTTLTPSSSGQVILSGNSDLWTSSAGYNQDLGIWISGGSYGSGQVVAWKESGGFAGTFSPNAAFVQTVLSLQGGTTYQIKLVWKANKQDSGTIWAGAGPINNAFSPTRLTAEVIPSTSSSTVSSAASTQQYTLTGSDGGTWSTMDGSTLSQTISPTSNSTVILSGNSDLWTSSSGYNQDIGIWVSGGSYGSGQVVAWKESGGFAGTFSPNAAFVQTVLSLQAGTSYVIKLVWKANKADPGTIWAGAGPINGNFSPTRLTAEVLASP